MFIQEFAQNESVKNREKNLLKPKSNRRVHSAAGLIAAPSSLTLNRGWHKSASETRRPPPLRDLNVGRPHDSR